MVRIEFVLYAEWTKLGETAVVKFYNDCETISTSFPNFVSLMNSLGSKIVESKNDNCS